MRLLHFADLHLDMPFQWAGPELARRRRQGLRDTLRRILELAVRERVDAVLCGGDLYEQDLFSPDTTAFVCEAFAQVHPLPVRISPGNHDWYGPQSLYSQVRWSPNVHVFSTDRLEPLRLDDGVTLWGGAHLAPAGARDFLDGFTVDREGVHLGLFHGSERGDRAAFGEGRDPHAPFQAVDLVRAGLHHAFCGHYHRPRDAPRHTYPGNPDPLTFGEGGHRGAVIATVHADGSVTRERHQVSSSEVHDLTLDVTGCASGQDIRERFAGLLGGRTGVARVTLTGEVAPHVELTTACMDGAAPWMEAVLIRLNKVAVAYDLEALAGEATVRGQFVRAVRGADMTEDDRRRVIVTGLRALDGRDDLEVA